MAVYFDLTESKTDIIYQIQTGNRKGAGNDFFAKSPNKTKKPGGAFAPGFFTKPFLLYEATIITSKRVPKAKNFTVPSNFFLIFSAEVA